MNLKSFTWDLLLNGVWSALLILLSFAYVSFCIRWLVWKLDEIRRTDRKTVATGEKE